MIPLLPQLALAATLVVGSDAPTAQATLDLARDGDVVVVPEGTWAGPLRIERTVEVRGEGGVIDGGGTGTAIRVAAPGAVVQGLAVERSGRDLRGPDACIYVEPEAVGAVIRDNRISSCAFGIWVHEAREVRIEDNHVVGITERIHPSKKGNGIHLFDSTRLVVSGNTVEHSRDGIYVSATEDSLIAGNHASQVRYGIHYMYSYDNTVRGNTTTHCTGGIALMESKGLTVEDNVATDNERRGILFRDVQDSTIRGNRVLRNGEGLFFFSSLDNVIEGNLVAHNQVGARVWAGSHRNTVVGNAFVGNGQQLLYVAAEDQTWGDPERGGNFWSDYLGWDQDGDGLGDRPYRANTFAGALLERFPSAVLLLNSPALELLSYLQARLPALRTPSIVDPWPLIRPPVDLEES